MLMSVAVAAEVSDDTTTVDTIAEEVEPVATEVTSPQTDNILEENDIETDMVYSGDNPQTISTLENETNTKTINKKNLISKKTDEQSPSIITLTTDNFSTYVTDGRFNEKVNEGDVIDFNGLFDGKKYSLTIDKPLNLTSLNNNAYLIFHSNANGGGNGFNIIKGGSGSNVTNIIFHDTHVRTEEAANITFNNISLTCDTGIGYGVGAISIRSSDNVNITNSYFKSKSNSGHSTVVYATSNNCLFENNTVLGEGNVGNLFYITTYGGSGYSYNITIRNNYIDNTKAYNQSICQAMIISGAGHLIENNTIIAQDTALGLQYYDPDFGEEGNPGEGTSIVKDNLILQGSVTKTENITYIDNIYPTKTLVINDDNFDKYIIIAKKTSRNTYIDLNFTSLEQDTPYNIVYNATPQVVFQPVYITTPSEYYLFKNGYGVRIIAGNENLKSVIYHSGTNLTGLYMLGSGSFWASSNDEVIYDSIMPKAATNFVYLNNTFLINYNRLVNYGNSNDLNDENSVIYQIVTNENYMNYFDEETGIIKDDLSSYNIIIDGEINKSLIFNKAVNLRGFNFALGYTLMKNSTLNNVKFIEGSENSNISWLKINNLTIQDTSNINIENNTIDGLLILNNSQYCKIISNDMDVFGRQITHPDSNIILYDSVNNFIEGNIIRTPGRFAISLDKFSYENLIQDNNLISGFYSRYYETPLFNYYGKECIENNGTNTLFNNSINPKYNLEFTTKTFAFNQENTLNADVSCEEFTVTIGKVIFSLNGTYLGEANVVDGVASLTFTPTALGSSSLSAWYVSDELDMPKGLTETVTVKDFIGTNVLIDYSGKVNSESFVTFTVTDEDGNPINDGQLTYSFATGEEKTITLTENTVTIPLEDTEHIAGKEVKVTYTPADSKYSSQTNTTTLDLEKANTQFTVVYDVIDDNNGNLTITLTDEFGNQLKEYKFNLVVDGVKTLETTDNNGVKVVSINSDKKEIEITATYLGNDAFINSTITKTVKLVKDPTTITVTSNKPTVSEILEINGTLKDEEKAISNAEVILSVNDENITLTTDENGEFTYSVEQPDKGSYTIIATFKGDENYKESTAKTKTYVKDPENVDVDDVLNQLEELKEQNQKQVEELQKNNEELQEQLNNLTQLNEELKEQLANQTAQLSEQLANKTDELSEQNSALQQQNEALQQQINTLSTIIGTLTDIIDRQNEQIAALNDLINNQSEEITNLNDKLDNLSASENTTIILNPVTDAKYKSDVVISGMLNSQKCMALSGQTITLTIGETSVDVTTKNGEFEYTTSFKAIGEQTVTASYAGNDNYNPSEDTITFNVEKQDMVLTINPIADAAYGDTITVSGTFTTPKGQVISNSVVGVYVNGKKYVVKTDADGVYSVDVKVTQVGENNVTVKHNGNDRYNGYETSVTFNAEKQDVIVTLDAIADAKVGDNVTITGKFTDANGKAMTNSVVAVYINGKKYAARTDSTGAFSLTTAVTKEGINNVTASYAGNDKYNAFESEVATFTAGSQDVIITADSIEDVTLGENVTITGKFTDKNGKAITNSVVRVTFDGKKYSARTDNTGSYTFTATTKTEGTNTVTLNYAGSSKYNAYETSTTFNVIKTE